MTLALNSSGSAGPFSMTQDLSLTVGHESILKSIAPITTYTPAKPKQRSWKRTFRGKKLRLGRKVVFTVELLDYEIPPTLRESLWRKNRDNQELALHKIIPDALNEHSLSTFWSTLLHAEELQVACVPGYLNI
jgi:hypothetical protein